MIERAGKLPSLPPAFVGKAMETMLSQYGNPDVIRCDKLDGKWVVRCGWGDRLVSDVVGSREEAVMVVETLRSDYMP